MVSRWRDRASFGELISPNANSLRVVIGLQFISSITQAATVGITSALELAIPVVPLLMIITAFMLWNVVSWRQLKKLEPDTDCEHQVLLQLLVSTVVLAALLYFTGGGTSPFVSLFLVPVAIGALCLSLPLASALALVASTAYTLLLFVHVPLAAQHLHGEAGFNFHVIGMWLNFLGSGSVLLLFLGLLAREVRERARSLADLRERQLRSEQVVAVAGIAAGAAHALATPLSTLSILLDELEERDRTSGEVRLAKDQLLVVQLRLDEILRSSAKSHTASGPEDLSESLNRTIRQWHQRRPESDLRVEQNLPTMSTAVDPALGHGLVTLLDNAADANVEAGTTRVALRIAVLKGGLQVEVEDEGGGPLPTDTAWPSSTKAHGHGVGLMILRTNLDRLGGVLGFVRGQKGSIARMSLPITRIVHEQCGPGGGSA